MDKLPYKILNVNDKPMFEINYRNEKKQFTPEQISSMILEKMKSIVESHTNEKVTDCVITVPAYFNDAQRQATKDAGVIAGLNVLRIINEPTAAAIAYGLDKMKEGDDKNILVFDFGGGTHDVSLLNISDGVFEVIATSGDTHLGGEDINHILIEHCIQEFEKKNRGKSIRKNDKARSRLNTACERVKRTLSSSTSGLVEVDSLYEGIDFSLSISRAKFEDLCGEIFRKTMQPVYDVLKQANMEKSKIDEIVLVGGSTRIPKVQNLLNDFFGKPLNNSINPDECVAYGATIQAAILSGIQTEQTENILLLDCTPLTLGIETSGEVCTPIIPKGTTIPAKKSQTFSTYRDNQPSATIKVLEGERFKSADNNVLGTFMLENVPPGPRGTVKINVTYDISTDGILEVTAEVENVEGGKKSLTIKNDSNRLSDEEVKRMVEEAEKFREEDEKLKEARDLLTGFENILYQNLASVASREETKHMKERIDVELDWIQANSFASKEEVEERKATFMKEYQDMMEPLPHAQSSEGDNEEPSTEKQKDEPTIEEVD